MRTRVFTLAVLLCGCLANASLFAGETLESRIENVINTAPYQNGQWGILAVDADTGKVVYERNADRMFCPASVTKLFTTAAAWLDLGPDYRFRTPVRRRGEIDENGKLRGELILVASGDLCLGGRAGADDTLVFTDNDHTYSSGNFKSTLVSSSPLAGLEALAKGVAEAGIKSIGGDILVDDRLFDHTHSTGSGPSQVVPIVVNDNVVDFVVTPGAAVGDPARVRIVPETGFVTFENHVVTVEVGEKPELDVILVSPRKASLRGKLPLGHAPAVRYVEVEEPASFARYLFAESLRRHGVDVGDLLSKDNNRGALPAPSEVAKLPTVAELTSPPLKEYVKVVLKVSHNLYASTFPLLLAAHHGRRSLSQGLQQEAAMLKQLGLEVGPVSFGGGAGGSRADLVTPRATVSLLRAMTSHPQFAAYKAGLPVLGEDGTLAKAVPSDSPARRHAQAKTGTYWVEDGLDDSVVLTSKALAGFMETKTGRPLIFAFFVNNVALDVPAKEVSDATTAAGRILGRLCEAFYEDEAPRATAN
jgi:D-alanyl-D-alanine carboxypeptidase/D-alanyl-D-alanine-endopeptidase (penicillin-binding protein 4)